MSAFLLIMITAIVSTLSGAAMWYVQPDNYPKYILLVEGLSILNISFLVGIISDSLNQASARSAKTTPVEWLPWATAVLYGTFVAMMHFGAWVPVLIAAVMMFPVFVLPPFIYRVIKPMPVPKPKLFTIEETCKTQDKVYMSKMIKDFRERYPQSNAYMYRSTQNHTAGGILLHSKEAVPEMTDTFIEVTLNCPFTLKFGNFAEGKEIFFAYLSKHLKTGTIVSPLPQKFWQTWLEGLTDTEWFERIEALDQMQPTHPCLEDYPCQFTDLSIKWEPFVWT